MHVASRRESVAPAGLEPATTPETSRALFQLSYGATYPSPENLAGRSDSPDVPR